MSKKLHKSRKNLQLIGAYDHLMFHLVTALSLCSLTEIRSSRCNLTTTLCLCALKPKPNPQSDWANPPGPFPRADWSVCYWLILWQSVSHNLLSGSLSLQTRREALKPNQDASNKEDLYESINSREEFDRMLTITITLMRCSNHFYYLMQTALTQTLSSYR